MLRQKLYILFINIYQLLLILSEQQRLKRELTKKKKEERKIGISYEENNNKNSI